MLLAENFLKVIINGYYTSTKIVGQQLIYNYKDQKFEAIRNRERSSLKMRLALLSFIAVATAVRIRNLKLQIKSTQSKLSPSVETNMCIMMLFMFVLCGERYRIRTKFPEDFVGFLNGAMSIEKAYDNGHGNQTTTKTKMAKYFFRATMFCQKWIFSNAVALACVLEKTLPLNTTWIFDQVFGFSNSTGLVAFVLKNGFIFGLNYCVWDIISIQGYLIAVDILVGGLTLIFCFDKAHRAFLKAMRKGKLCFWPTSDTIPSEITMYRANHVLSETYNAAVRSALFLFLLTCGIAQIASAVTLINQKDSDSVPILGNIFFATVALQVVPVILIVYGIGGDFYKASVISLQQLKRNVGIVSGVGNRRDRKYLKRFLDSCQVGKVKFGLSNFIEKTTPPICQLFCVNRIVDLLLLR